MKAALGVPLEAAQARTQGQELKRLSLDDGALVRPGIEPDAKVKAGGTGSPKIATLWPTTVCLGKAVGPGIESAKLVNAARVGSELDGTAFLEMWTHVGGGQFFSRGDERRGRSKVRMEDDPDPVSVSEGTEAREDHAQAGGQRPGNGLDRRHRALPGAPAAAIKSLPRTSRGDESRRIG